MKTLRFIQFSLMIASCSLLAQKAETPQHSYDVGGKIELMTLTDPGILVINGGGGLTGIKPGAASPHFSFKDYGKVKAEEMSFVPMTPYVVISQGGMFSSSKAVLDIVSGKKLFATEDNGWKYSYRADVIMPQNKLVVCGVKKDLTIGVGIYDLSNGKEDTFVALNDPNKVSIGSAFEFTGAPTLIDGGLFVPTSKSLVRIDLNNGSILWSNKDLDKVNWVTSDGSGKEVYAFEERENGDTRIHKVSSSGQLLWEKERKIKGKVSRFQILPQGLAVVSDVDNSGKSTLMKIVSTAAESKIAFLNAADGTDLWEKAPKTKGYVQHFYVMDDGILFGMFEGGINKISFDGNTLFKKPLKTGENIRTMAMTPKGMIYITDTDADIINLQNGESIWNKPIKYKKAKAVSSAYDSQNHRYLISTGEEVVAIDENSGDISSFANFEFKGGEVANSIEVRNDGILLASDQNMLFLNFDGSTKFNNYYRAPGKSAAGAILAGLGTVASVAMAGASAAEAQNHRQVSYVGGGYYTIGDYNSTGKSYMDLSNSFANLAGASFAEMTKRFKATSASENARFILTKFENGDIGLVKIDKDTGEKLKEISLNDKKPEYEVDDYAGFLYYQPNNSTINSYVLQ